jgi:hypothetical protein
LFHAIGVKRFLRIQTVGVRIAADPQRSVRQIACLGRGAADEVPPGSPGLVLRAMRELVGQYRHVVAGPIRQKYRVAERHRPIAAQEQHGPAHDVARSSRTAIIDPDPGPIHPIERPAST